MKNTEAFYNNLRWYFQAVDEINAEYGEAMKYADRFKGSTGGKELADKAAATRDASLAKERERVNKRMKAIFADMRVKAQARTLTAPTPEQAAIVAALRSRKNVTLEEIRQAENSLSGCPLALSQLDELARDHGYAKLKQRSGPMTTEDVLGHISQMEKSIERTLRGEAGRFNRLPKDADHAMTTWGNFAWGVTQDEWGVQHTVVPQETIAAFTAAVDGE